MNEDRTTLPVDFDGIVEEMARLDPNATDGEATASGRLVIRGRTIVPGPDAVNNMNMALSIIMSKTSQVDPQEKLDEMLNTYGECLKIGMYTYVCVVSITLFVLECLSERIIRIYLPFRR